MMLVFLAVSPLGESGAMARDGLAVEPEKITRASKLEPGHGVVIISLRSELYLRAELDLFFLREGGDLANEEDVIRISRSQPALAFGNATTKYKPLSVQLPAGRYRMAAHGSKCPKIPAPNERCLVDISFLGIGDTISLPSRGYGDDAPIFEVREGALTVAGDFGLTARNTVEWSQIPGKKLNKVIKRFYGLPRGPAPRVGKEYVLKYPLRPRSIEDDRGRRF
ncbi:MAG: hypothetical protein AAFR64_03100 [Pseudomonadota bacterium]